MKPIQGRLRSFGVRTTQGEWTFDVSAITGAGAAAAPAQHVAGADAQPQPSAPPQCPGGRDANLAKNNSKPSSRIGQQSHTDTSRARNVPLNDDNEDDDVFMEPPPRQPVAKKQCINATAKPPKNPVKYAHAPTVRCAPSTFNSFVDHLTLQQRRRIKAMGFGGLLCVSAERLESRELLKFLFDRLDPKTMVIHVTKDKGIHVTPFVVKQVLELPDGGEYINLHTHTQASKELSAFKTLLGLEESHGLHASHLQNILVDDLKLGSGMINDDMAIRFFFIIACNKLLFPSTDNNIRCKDVYLTRDLSSLPSLNWCKAVVDDLREAALTWQTDKAKNSFSGCAILLIILYLDSLECQHQIEHKDTPRVKYFHQNVIKRIISADKTKDQQGKATFGLLPLRNSIDTCYHTTQHPSTNTPPSIEPLATERFPSIQAELRGLVDQISCGPRKKQAMLALSNFDAKAKKASSYVSIGQQMLQDAHQAAIRTLQAILNDEMHGINSEDHGNQPHACDAGQADDVDMYDGHASDVPSIHPETMQNDMSSGAHTNHQFNQGAAIELQQNRNQEQVLPTSTTMHNTVNYSIANPSVNADLDKEMDVELSPVCTQVHTDVTIDHVVPPVVDEGYTSTASMYSS